MNYRVPVLVGIEKPDDPIDSGNQIFDTFSMPVGNRINVREVNEGCLCEGTMLMPVGNAEGIEKDGHRGLRVLGDHGEWLVGVWAKNTDRRHNFTGECVDEARFAGSGSSGNR
jgi:hypothetical protein